MPGFVRGYSADRMKLEVIASRFDDLVPRKHLDELEHLAIERRKKAYVSYAASLPLQLETLKARFRVQDSSLKHVITLLKGISLFKFGNIEG